MFKKLLNKFSKENLFRFYSIIKSLDTKNKINISLLMIIIILLSLILNNNHKKTLIPVEKIFTWQDVYATPQLKITFNDYKIVPPPYLDENLDNKPLLGVMIENSVPSRIGMKGLSTAKIVYETLAEGGITRFLALYTTDNPPSIIGPIRSVRDYYLDWAEEYNLTLLHCGGSDSVMPRLPTAKIKDVDEFNDFYAENYFFRDKNFYKPHNLFSNTDYFFNASTALNDKRALNTNNLPINSKKVIFTGQEFLLDQKHKGVIIDFFDDDYKVEYIYDNNLKTYKRLNGGETHIDTNNNQFILVDNILIQETDYQVMDEKLHLNIDTKSQGKCIFFTKGTYENCLWVFLEQKTKFTDLLGNELKFNKGNLWIEVVSNSSPVKIYN